jgi:uncharacterized membrane protein YqhA
MNSRSIAGIVVLVLGVILLVVGLNASHSVADQVSDTFSGKYTQNTMWYILGGVGLGLLGLLMTVFGIRGKSA